MVNVTIPGGDPREPSPWQSRRLWSLWDMINFTLYPFIWALKLVQQEIAVGFAKASADARATLSDEEKKRVAHNFKAIARECQKINLESAEHRLGRISSELRVNPQVHWIWLATEFQTLLETIEDDCQFERFYHYDKMKGSMLLRVAADWASTMSAFPSAKEEIDDAVDCYATGHPTSAVFHLMRLAELGLRALARERRVVLPKKRPLEWEDWNGLIEGIRKKVNLIANKPRGSNRERALEFYRGALGEFEAFKDEFRNNVMHMRRRYDDLEAQRALNHVQSFMERLASKIDETGKKQIAWGRM